MEISYQLNSENFIEYQTSMAFYNKPMQKKCLILMLSTAVTFSAIVLLIFDFGIISLLIILVGLAVLIIFFPKVYWVIVAKKIRGLTEKTQLKFDPINLKITDRIYVEYAKMKFTIDFKQIVALTQTKENYVINYSVGEKMDALIIPFTALEGRVSEFDSLIKGGVDDEK